MDEDEVAEYTELSATDLLRTPKAEYVAESDILEHLKQLRLAAVDRHQGAVGIISVEELDVKPSPEQLATANSSQKTSTSVSLRLWSKSCHLILFIKVSKYNNLCVMCFCFRAKFHNEFQIE